MITSYGACDECAPPHGFGICGCSRGWQVERVERFYLIDILLRAQAGGVARETLLTRLETSLSTFKRDLEYMRERLWAPIVWDSNTGKYKFDFSQAGADRYNLPGLWFSPREAHALLVLESMLQQIQPGALTEHTSPFRVRLERLLETSIDDREQLRRRIRILSMGGRAVDFAGFSLLAHAVLKRKQNRSGATHSRTILFSITPKFGGWLPAAAASQSECCVLIQSRRVTLRFISER